MDANTSAEQPTEKSDMRAAILRWMLQISVTILIQAAILFISSGRLDWVMAWAYIGVNVDIVAVNTLVILPKDPELIVECPRTKENTKDWDRTLTRIGAIPYLAMWVVAGVWLG